MQDSDIITSISEEISCVLKKNLYVLLNPIMEEQNKTNEALLNFPITQKLTNKIKQLEMKLLESNCQKNIKIFELRQEIKRKDEKIKDLEKQLNNICSIKLEVKELNTVNEEVDLDSINIISHGTNKKIDNKPIKLSTNMWNLLGSDEEDEEYDEEYDGYHYSEDDDEEVEDASKLNSSHEEVEAQDDEDSPNMFKNCQNITDVTVDKEEADQEENQNSDSEEELELEEIVINEIKYLTDCKINGTIYKCDEDGEIIEDDEGDLIIVGKFDNKRSELYF